MPLTWIEGILSIFAIATTLGLVVTAKDLAKMKDEFDNRYVLKEVHQSEIAALKADIADVQKGQDDIQKTVMKIYTFLLESDRGRK